ncbi:MAG: PilX N-terminal domain-containing pilus assembly protein [Betaproteobacteria bacterium]
MKVLRSNEQGFILMLSVIMLLIITILVLNSVRTSTMNEKMSGGYMDRSLAQNLAELAIAEGQESLVSSEDNADKCRSGCSVTGLTAVTANATAADLPSNWPSNDAGAINSSNGVKAKFVVTLLADTAIPSGNKQSKCKPYSIMGRGEGNDSRTVVVLQVVAFVCDLDA